MDMENVKFTLKNITTTLGLILENMGDEHVASEDCTEGFYARMDDVYIPALDLIQDAACGLLKEIEVKA